MVYDVLRSAKCSFQISAFTLKRIQPGNLSSSSSLSPGGKKVKHRSSDHCLLEFASWLNNTWPWSCHSWAWSLLHHYLVHYNSWTHIQPHTFFTTYHDPLHLSHLPHLLHFQFHLCIMPWTRITPYMKIIMYQLHETSSTCMFTHRLPTIYYSLMYSLVYQLTPYYLPDTYIHLLLYIKNVLYHFLLIYHLYLSQSSIP